jgi:hypothetical protein
VLLFSFEGRRHLLLCCLRYIFVEKHFIATTPNILAHPIEYLKGVGPQRADLLKKELAIFSFQDLLYHFPYRHVDKTRIIKIILTSMLLRSMHRFREDLAILKR